MNIQEHLDQLTEEGRLRTLPALVHHGKYIESEGRKMLNLSGNDYLGLGSNTELRHTFLSQLTDSEVALGACSSRLLTGNSEEHQALEATLEAAYGRRALLFNSGYHANLGILPALTDRSTPIFADKLIHASLIDALRLCDAPYHRFRHNDISHLTSLLNKHLTTGQRAIVVTESIFSMDGDRADLAALVALKEEHPGLMLYVDEAHAVGVCGKRGLGLAEALGLTDQIDLLVGTFGKAFASMGAYLICSNTIRSYLINTARPLIFSTALPPATVAWSKYTFEHQQTLEETREHLRQLSLRIGTALGIAPQRTSHILPLIVGENAPTIQLADELRRKGFYLLPIRPPTVPQGTSRLRFSLSSDLTFEEIDPLLQLLTPIAQTR